MMKEEVHKAGTRGVANSGGRLIKHTFSYSNYYNPDRMNFGVLRVLNEYTLAPGKSLDRQSFKNMEVLSIVLQGELRFTDDSGARHVYKKGDIHVLSSGTGMTVLIENNSNEEELKFLELWFLPEEKDIIPQFSVKTMYSISKKNKLATIFKSIDEVQDLGWNLNVRFSVVQLEDGENYTYSMKQHDSGLYVFVIEGDVQIGGRALSTRDGYAVVEAKRISMASRASTQMLAIEVPKHSKKRNIGTTHRFSYIF